MPSINEQLGDKSTTAVAEVQVVPATESTATSATSVVDATVVEKPKKPAKVKKVKTESVKTESKTKTETDEAEAEKIQLTRPPLEQLTKDFEASLVDHEIDGHKLVKLGYKCGKIIYGLKHTDGAKDFRVIAFKARKKSKSVNGKSRCIFYFGLNQAKAKEIVKQHPEVKVSTFGKCSVQSHSPVELILDRTTYTEKFDKNIDKVNTLMNSLVIATVESKTEQYAEMKQKAAAAEEKTSKKKAEKKTEKKKD